MTDARLVERGDDTTRHVARAYCDVLQAEGHLAVGGRIDRLQLRVLEHEADVARQLARRRRHDIAACHLGMT